MSLFRALAWDIDGTLIDSEPLHQRALVAASAALGELCGRAARVEMFEGHARSGDVRAAKYAGHDLSWDPR